MKLAKAEDQGVDSEIVYGDYYMIEALMRYLSVTAWEDHCILLPG